MKLTQKQLLIGDIMVKYYQENGKGLCCYELIKLYKNDLIKNNIDTNRINSVNATLASLASKELCNKTKVVYNDKMVTCYTPTDLGLKTLLNQDKNNTDNAKSGK